MKKIILLVAVMLTSLLQAQGIVEVTTTGGAPIAEGQVFVFNNLYSFSNQTAGKLPIQVKNISNQPLKLKIKVQAIANNAAVADNVQLCFGTNCYSHVNVGMAYPNTGIVIAPGASNDAEDHFLNSYAGDVAGQPVDYTLQIVQYNDNNVEIATLRTFTFRYSATMGINDFASLKSLGITVKSTVINNVVEIDATQNATLQVYSINGQLVKTAAIATGTQAIDASALATGVYIARFTTEDNKTSSIKIAKN
jgi:hypothetical protein